MKEKLLHGFFFFFFGPLDCFTYTCPLSIYKMKKTGGIDSLFFHNAENIVNTQKKKKKRNERRLETR